MGGRPQTSKDRQVSRRQTSFRIYCTVSVSNCVAVVNPVPEAEIVSVETTGVGGLFELLPPPHPPAELSSAADATTTMVMTGHLLRRNMAGTRNRAANASIPWKGTCAALAEAAAVRTETPIGVVLPSKVTVTGEGTVHVSPAGAPSQENVTAPE
jgi:hypothetical protein